MKELCPEVEINQEEAAAIARGLITVANADGEIHPAEAALINEFYASITDHPADFCALRRAPALDGPALAQLLKPAPLREVFIKTALLLAYADGKYSPGEAEQISEFAEALGLDAQWLAETQSIIKEYLLSQLSHLQNVEASIKVARDLEL